MKKLFLLSACTSLAIACGSSANDPRTKAEANRVNSTASNTNFNANPKSLKENAYSTASTSSLGSFMEYVGKTASEIKLWQNKEIDKRLSKLMGSNYAKMKKFWNTETPIKKFGDFLMMSGCEKHNCGDNQYVIFMGQE